MSGDNIAELNKRLLARVTSVMKFAKTLIFKNERAAATEESKASLVHAAYYIDACLDLTATVNSNLPPYILTDLPNGLNSTNNDIVNLYKNNTIELFNEINETGVTIKDPNFFFAEWNSYYRTLFIDPTFATYNLVNIFKVDSVGSHSVDPFKGRIFNHLDILGFPSGLLPITDLALFLELYSTNKVYFMKTMYTAAFEGQENYYNFCKFTITFMSLQQFINKSMEIAFDVDLIDSYSIRNLLYSYGIYFLDDLPDYYQRRVVKNLHRLLTAKGSTQVISNILDIFEISDSVVFKYYMEKEYNGNGTANNVIFNGIPYNEYNLTEYSYKHSANPKLYPAKKRSFERLAGVDDKWLVNKEFILDPINQVSFNRVQSKYYSIESTVELQKVASEITFFYNTIYHLTSNHPESAKIKDIPPSDYCPEGYSLFNGLIALASISILVTGAQPIIYRSVNSFNSNAFLPNLDLNNVSLLLQTKLNLVTYKSLIDMNSLGLLEVTTNIEENLRLKTELENLIVNTSNYDDYITLLEDYKYLFQAETNRNFFPLVNPTTNVQYVTYIDYLLDVEPTLGNSILDASVVTSKKDLIRLFGLISDDMKSLINSNKFIYTQIFSEYVLEYVSYMINYFKSYTIELENLAVIYSFDNEFENTVPLKDKAATAEAIRYASLLGPQIIGTMPLEDKIDSLTTLTFKDKIFNRNPVGKPSLTITEL